MKHGRRTKRRLVGLVFGALALPAAARAGFRPPAVPLITHDPYFSVWSMADRLYEDWPKHWTGANNAMCGMVRVDGVPMRFMGGHDGKPNPIRQTQRTITPTRSLYTFEAGPVLLNVTFTSPLLPDDLDILSRPASYVTFTARSRDGRPHDVTVYFDISAEWVVDEPSQPVTWGRLDVPGQKVMRVGSTEQKILGRAGDDLRIDWGHLLLGVPNAAGTTSVIGSADTLRRQFQESGTLPSADDPNLPRAANAQWPVLCARMDLGRVSTSEITRHLTVAYDDIFSIEHNRNRLRAWWRRDPGMTSERLMRMAEDDYVSLSARCSAFDQDLVAEARRAGGEAYADLCALAYRQTHAAHKIVAGTDGIPLSFSKENFSNGCIATVDVTYPSSPFFLRYNSALLKGQLLPVLQYARTEAWPFPFAPHDLGTYPLANGQVYGLVDGQLRLELQMPVEESGNMLILAAALSQVEKNAAWARPYWPILARWADYLVENGLDPVNQLCTADMFGHMAHNADLSLKAIIGIGAYATLCRMEGRTEEADRYLAISRDYAVRWQTMAADDKHTRLAFDRPGSWGMKHNLIWDRILGLNLFPESVGDQEIAWYKSVQGEFGLPCDSRTSQGLIDWAVWCAALARNRTDFEELVSPLHRYAHETPSRVPLSDWFDTTTGRRAAFQARSVVGGIFMRFLKPLAVPKGVPRAPASATGWKSPTPDGMVDVGDASRPGGVVASGDG